MVCPKCRLPVIENARFCGSCGQPLAPANERAQVESRITPPLQGYAATATAAGMGPGDATSVGTGQSSPFLRRVKGTLLTPRDEWQTIAPELTSVGQLYTSYVFPLAGVAALMSFVRMSVIGVSLPFGDAIRTPVGTGLVYALMTFGMGLVGLFLVGLIINMLAPTFAGVRDQRQALKVAAYAFTPAWLSTIFNLLPSFGTLLQLVAGVYGIYLLYLGLPVLMRSAKERAFGYTASVVICTIVLGVLLGALSAAVGGFGRMAGLGAYGNSTPAGFQSREAAREAARNQGAAMVGNMIGNALGTDEKGKAGLGAALANLAKAGEQIQQTQAGATAAATPAASGATAQAPAQAGTAAMADAAGGTGAAGGAGAAVGAGAAGNAAMAGGPGAAGNVATAGNAAAATNAAMAGNAGAATNASIASNTMAGNTAAATNAAAATTGLLAALGGAMGGSRRVEPVDFRALEAILPASLPGMTRSGAQGSTRQAMGVKGSSATGSYRDAAGAARVEIKISDISGVSGLLDAAGSLVGSESSESDSGFEKDATVSGRAVHEKYDNRARHGEVDAIVAKRFEVDVTGDAVDMVALERYLGSVDLAKLESMRDAGAQQ